MSDCSKPPPCPERRSCIEEGVGCISARCPDYRKSSRRRSQLSVGDRGQPRRQAGVKGGDVVRSQFDGPAVKQRWADYTGASSAISRATGRVSWSGAMGRSSTAGPLAFSRPTCPSHSDRVPERFDCPASDVDSMRRSAKNPSGSLRSCGSRLLALASLCVCGVRGPSPTVARRHELARGRSPPLDPSFPSWIAASA